MLDGIIQIREIQGTLKWIVLFVVPLHLMLTTSSPVHGEPFICLPASNDLPQSVTEAPQLIISGVPGFSGLTDQQALTTVFEQIMSPTTERVLREEIGDLTDTEIPEDLTMVEYREKKLAQLRGLRETLLQPHLLFCLPSEILNDASSFQMWIPGEGWGQLFKWDNKSKHMLQHEPRDDEGYHQCMLLFTGVKDGRVNGELKFAWRVIGNLHWDTQLLEWDTHESHPPSFVRLGEYRWDAVMDFY